MFHLLATFAIGAAAAGFVWLVFRTVRRKAPRYLIPLAAGAAMLAYNIWSEYTWYGRTVAGLPDHVVVVNAIPYESGWQPWTLVFPRVNRLVAIDTTQTRKNDKLPGFILAELVLAQRHDPTVTVLQMYDCNQARRTDVATAGGFDEDGLPLGADWLPVDVDSPLFSAVCRSS